MEGISRDKQLFVGWDYPDLNAGVADFTIARAGLRVTSSIQTDSELLETGADLLPNGGGVFADATGEDERFGSTHRREIRADIFLCAITEDIEGKAGALVALVCAVVALGVAADNMLLSTSTTDNSS